MRLKNLILVFGLFLLLGAFLEAQNPTVKLTGTFSNLEYNEEGGDLLGSEVFIFFAGEHWVLYQESIGEPVEPSLVRAKVNGDSIEFTVPDIGGAKKTFKGKITKTHLIGKFSGSKAAVKLARKKSYWQ